MRSELIYDRAKKQQIIAYDGMSYGPRGCRPTDLDMSLDFDKRLFFLVEFKHVGKDITIGQRIHLEGLVDAIVAGGRQALAILAHHNTPDTDTDVHAAESTVARVYDGVQWVDEGDITLDKYIRLVYGVYSANKGGRA